MKRRSCRVLLLLLLAFATAACAGIASSERQSDESVREAPADKSPETPTTSTTESRKDGVLGLGGGDSSPKPEPGGIDLKPRDVSKPPAAGPRPSSPGVKAGSADDNQQFHAFLEFLEKNRRFGLALDVSERVVVSVKDRDGLPLPGARVTVRDGNASLLERRTYADGRALVFPSQAAELRASGARLEVSYRGKTGELSGRAAGQHRVEMRLDLQREAYTEVPLDIAFVLDTTGSMGDEIASLKRTIEFIHFQVSHLQPRPAVRFGMVLFRDRGDEYHVQVVPFTADLRQFQGQLDKVQAGGGGDTPEDVQAALEATVKELDWRSEGVKIAFLVGDAPPHLDYGQTFTYLSAMQEAARKGIKLCAIGASGLDIQGELVWRQLAQYTLAPFVFLTYGESGDSAGGPAGGVSHHIGSNWAAENLDAIVIRLVKVELSHYSPTGAAPTEDFFAASPVAGMTSDSVLEDLFAQSVRQLVDYCVLRLSPKTPTQVLPVKADKKLKALADRLQKHLALGLSRRGEFQLIEVAEQARLLETLTAQFAGKYDETKVAELGKLVPAKLVVFSELSDAGPAKVELLVRLVRLETGEILSLSMLKIEEGLLVAWR